MRALWGRFIVSEWCNLTHGGGHIQRDPSGRVNWQCNKCGRWAEPVSELDEANLLRQHTERKRMNLQELGYRFILRVRDRHVVGDWEHPAHIKPGGTDVTDLPDDKMAATIYDMQDSMTPCRWADVCNEEGTCGKGCERIRRQR